MTVQQFIDKFKLSTEIISSYESPGIMDSEICDLLNTAQMSILSELCANKQFDNIYSLIVREGVRLSPETVGVRGDNLVSFRGNFLGKVFFPIGGQIAVKRTSLQSTGFIPNYNTTNSIVELESIPVESAVKFIGSALNKNDVFLYPKYWFESKEDSIYGTLKVVVDRYTSLGEFTDNVGNPNVVFAYIKTPDSIDITTDTTSELPEYLHESLLQRAIDLKSKNLVNNINKS